MSEVLDNHSQEKSELFFWKKYRKGLTMVLNKCECFCYERKSQVILNFYWELIEFKIPK